MPGINSISERISELVKVFADGNKTRFASMVGTSEANIRNYVDNGKSPKFDFIKKVCEQFEISCDWFILGKGTMFKEKTHPVESIHTSSSPDLKPLADLIEKMHSEVKDLTTQLAFQTSESQYIRSENTSLVNEIEELRKGSEKHIGNSARHNIHSKQTTLTPDPEADHKKDSKQ